MKITEGRIHILSMERNGQQIVEINLYDADSSAGTPFAQVHLSTEQFVRAALGRLGYSDVQEMEVHQLERVGKIHEHKIFAFPLNRLQFDRSTKDRKRYAKERLLAVCPEGWVGDAHFSSQNSFFIKDKETWARTRIRRWVDREEG